MLALPTMETAILDRAHLVGIAAPEHLGHKVIIVGRIITRTKLFKPRPVIGKYLFEDVPVPRGFCNHQGAPSWGIGIVAVPLFYHGSPPQSTPASAFTEAPSPTSLTRKSRGLPGSRKMKIPRRSRYPTIEPRSIQ